MSMNHATPEEKDEAYAAGQKDVAEGNGTIPRMDGSKAMLPPLRGPSPRRTNPMLPDGSTLRVSATN